jgi:hypothetical protein
MASWARAPGLLYVGGVVGLTSGTLPQEHASIVVRTLQRSAARLRAVISGPR